MLVLNIFLTRDRFSIFPNILWMSNIKEGRYKPRLHVSLKETLARIRHRCRRRRNCLSLSCVRAQEQYL